MGRLQLLIEHAPIRDDDDGVKDLRVLFIMQACQPVREPGDRARLAGSGRSRSSRSCAYWCIASAARCPVSGFFSSAVTTGMPLTARVTSMMQRLCPPPGFFMTEVKPAWRVIVRRFLAYCSAASGFMRVFGRK